MNSISRRMFLKFASFLPTSLLFGSQFALGLPLNKGRQRASSSGQIRANSPWSDKDDFCLLNDDYTFSNFIVSRTNEFAHAACYAVSEHPGQKQFNPLFICGPTGMGKTHLMNAIAHRLLEKNPKTRIRSLSAERFLNEFISALRRNELKTFRNTIRNACDILMVDDVQILGRGEAVQEEFRFTLEHFLNEHKQVVVTSDYWPKDIRGLDGTIRSRFEWGLIADMSMPNLETRKAILKFKAAKHNIQLDEDTFEYIAAASNSNIRQLEGNLNKLRMAAELNQLQPSLALAKSYIIKPG